MQHRRYCLIILLMVFTAQTSWAVETPPQTQQNQDTQTCIAIAKQRCLRDMCINTEELNCPNACQKRAEENCTKQSAP